MTAPNKGTITASIERSLRNCSLNHHQSSSNSSSNSSDTASAGIIGGPAGFVAAGRSSTSDSTINLDFPDNALELHSDIRLPYYWEQCLDLKSGEVYYINWRTGMKSQEDPRTNPEMQHVRNGGLGLSWSEEEDEDGSWYESEGSSTEESSPSTSSRQQQCRRRYSNSNSNSSPSGATPRHRHRHLTAETNIHHDKPQVLVVAGCKSCFMYFMLPKQVQDCPKCFGQLLHFDRSENASP
ncbi:uncharacterized protein LOC113753999 [Coffea eugenioides]|uniref:uncharacterized protein LOC113753999 n=1 Tax=Coffea eugenioides TaxID=49369 RepID=UPI000F612BB1|nr:uncharacterized protein LOC113753999 [Coffea eugenioides]